MNRFQIAELKGRDLFEKALLGSGITDYEFTDGRYDRVDVFFTADTLAYCGEIKYRKYPSTQSFFQTEGVVLEICVPLFAVVLRSVSLPALPTEPSNNRTITQNHHLLKRGFLFFAPQDGQDFALFAISLPQALQAVIL